MLDVECEVRGTVDAPLVVLGWNGVLRCLLKDAEEDNGRASQPGRFHSCHFLSSGYLEGFPFILPLAEEWRGSDEMGDSARREEREMSGSLCVRSLDEWLTASAKENPFGLLVCCCCVHKGCMVSQKRETIERVIA